MSVHLPPFEGVRRQRLPFFWKMHPEGFLLHSLFLLRPNTSQDSVASGSGASGTGVNGGPGPGSGPGRGSSVSGIGGENGKGSSGAGGDGGGGEDGAVDAPHEHPEFPTFLST